MARGCIVKRCPECRGKKKEELKNHQCSPHKVSYHITYWWGKKQHWERAGRTKKEAEQLLERRLAEVRGGTYRENKKVLFQDFAELWLENVPKPRVKESTFRGYQTDVRKHFIPYFGHQFLDSIRREHVETFLARVKEKEGRGRDKCEKQLDPKTVNNIRGTLHMIFDYARRLNYIFENPVSDVRPFKVEKKEMDILQPNEIRLLLKHAREPHRTLFLTAVLTGMRRSELLGLQWGDIDWNGNTISVRRSLYWSEKRNVSDGNVRWKFVTTKSKRSTRALFLSPKLKEALEIHRINAPVSAYDLVFCNQDGQPIDGDNMFKRQFLPTLSMAGIRRVRFHDLRHTYATLLISQGENPKFIQSQMGHASITTTMDTYGHLLPVDHVAVGEKVDKLVFGNPSNKNLTSVGQEPTTYAKNEADEAVVIK